ncbi:MAG: GumC family protein [Calditrichaceae bacterium]
MMTENSRQRKQDEVNLLDYFTILLKWRKIIIYSFIIFSVTAIFISLIIPKTYRASSVIMPSTDQGGLMSAFPMNLPSGGLLSSFGGLFGGASDESYTLLAILDSRTIAENTITHFDLMKRYDNDNMEQAIKTFKEHLDFSMEEEGTIEITFDVETGYLHFDKDEEEARQLSAEINNYIVDELNRIFTELQTSQAKSFRLFIEKRYDESKQDIKTLEQQMKDFSQTSGMISLPDQISAAITAAAELEGEIISKEIEMEALKQSLNPNHSFVKKLNIELIELRKKIKELKLGTAKRDSMAIFPVFSEAPELGIKYLRLKREAEVQEIIYQFVTQQYEQAKLQEVKNTPSIQIIDKAVPPVKKFKPIRWLIVVVSGLLGIFTGIFFSFLNEYMSRLKLNDPERYLNFSSLIKETKSDLFGRKSRIN